MSSQSTTLVASWVVLVSAYQYRRHKGCWFDSLGWEDPLEKGIATHSSIFAWRIPWTEEPGGLQEVTQSQT